MSIYFCSVDFSNGENEVLKSQCVLLLLGLICDVGPINIYFVICPCLCLVSVSLEL